MRRFINQLGERENIDQVFLLADKQLRANRAGNLYLQLRVSDKTGSLTGMLWNASEKVAGSFSAGSFVRVQGATQLYNGNLQLIVTRVDPVDPTTVDEADFVTLNQANVEHLATELSTALRAMSNLHLRNLAECYLIDETLMQKFYAAPAGIKNHHAYRGGLLEHVVNLIRLVKVVAPFYPQVDSDLLLTGAFLHDIGKVDELVYEREMGYSDEGQMLGHMVIAVSMLDGKLKECEEFSGQPFPAELALRIKHMIISHHGQYEFGSPKLPMTLEAIALHFLDNFDAKIHHFTQLVKEDVNSESHWTAYQPSLERKIFKGTVESEN
jgi:3'-5' exoribonuclease